ncbi:SIMPL domain-containing protein [Mariniradius sediminis]|uniref:SIMPL domain-containing protein n=1 Tax=Mariniradius sediminis TaxID=2909237 RepID=A0ABS9BPV5_9BACT|nr:SIMPL domain-containing protein [Mariniradius sediminis]MCF1750085.1 SIMPL domain-containing protein [Mariniradius sediminis]
MKKLLYFLPLFLLAFTAFAQKEIPLIEVEGVSEVSVMPDEAVIQINLVEKALKVADATNGLNKKTKSIEDALKKTKVKDYVFTVDNYFVNVNRIWTNNSSKDSGYVASQNIKIKLKNTGDNLVKITETLHQTADMGFQVQFVVSDELRKSTEKQLLELALADAKSKAETIAKAMGIQTIKVFHISYGAPASNYPVVLRGAAKMEMAAMDAYESPVFNPDEQKISDRVRVAYTF